MTNLIGSLLINAIVPRWRQYALGSVLLLLLVSAGLLLAAHPALTDSAHCNGWRVPVCRPLQHGSTGRWALGIGAAVLVIATSSAAHAAADPLLALLTGAAWPDWKPVRRWAETRHQAHYETWQKLERQWTDPSPTVTGSAVAIRAYERWRCYPTKRMPGTGVVDMAPTLIGNIIAAGQQRVLDRHGLDLVVCWAPLTAALPESTRTELAEATNTLRLRLQHFALAMPTPVWPLIVVTSTWPWPWRVAAVAGASAVCATLLTSAWRRLRSAVADYVEFVEYLVLVHRTALYVAAGFGLPDSTLAEREIAQQLRAALTDPLTDHPLIWKKDE